MTWRSSRASALAASLALALLAQACSGGTPSSTPPVASVASTPTVEATIATPTPTPTPTPSPTPTPTWGPFSAAAAMADIEALSVGIGARPAGSAQDAEARRYVIGQFVAAGWTATEEQVELPQGGTSANVVATLDARDLEGPHVVIGAHLDTIAGAPGANDNASGTGVVLELARVIAEGPPLGVPVVLVAFGAEEYQPAEPRLHHLGSDAYAERYAEHVIAALSVDMIGNGDSTCICWLDLGPFALAARVEAVAESAGISAVHVESRGDISDHGPFARRGIPAAFLWTGDDGRLHTPADTFEHVRAQDVQRAGDLVRHFVLSLTLEDRDGLEAG